VNAQIKQTKTRKKINNHKLKVTSLIISQ